MKVIDLTHTIKADMPVYPGTEPPTLLQANTIEKDLFKETKLSPPCITTLLMSVVSNTPW